jgi:hypothetical protein
MSRTDLTFERRRIVDQLTAAIRQGDDEAAENLLHTWDALTAGDVPQPTRMAVDMHIADQE